MLDWFPTLLEAIGLSYVSEVPFDGLNVWPHLVEGEGGVPRTIIMPNQEGGGAIWKGDWKYINSPKEKKPMLFNIINDPNEISNQSTSHPDKVKLMDKLLREKTIEYLNDFKSGNKK